MELLVCGMHRSGTTAVARLVTEACGKTLLDDPEWAIEGGCLSYREDPALAEELEAHDVVKCPRMAEVLDDVVEDLEPRRVAYLVRDPRDVWCSIREKVLAGAPTRMLEYRRVGVDGEGAVAFTGGYVEYLRRLEESAALADGTVVVVEYERFFPSPPEGAERLARSLGWTACRETLAAMAEQQLAPRRNKPHAPDRIVGPGRWSDELPDDEVAALEPATAARQRLLDEARRRHTLLLD